MARQARLPPQLDTFLALVQVGLLLRAIVPHARGAPAVMGVWIEAVRRQARGHVATASSCGPVGPGTPSSHQGRQRARVNAAVRGHPAV